MTSDLIIYRCVSSTRRLVQLGSDEVTASRRVCMEYGLTRRDVDRIAELATTARIGCDLARMAVAARGDAHE